MKPKARQAALRSSTRTRRGIFAVVCLSALGLTALLGTGAPAAGAAEGECPNEAIRVQQGQTALALPDCRAYEMVSPVVKNGSVPQFPVGPAGPGYLGFSAFTGAAADGEQLMWFAMLPLPLARSGLPMNYEAHRTASGWTTDQASPDPTDPTPSVLASLSPVYDATEDFSQRVLYSPEQFDPLIQDPFGRFDLFLQDAQHNLSWVSRPDEGAVTSSGNPTYYGRDSAANHIVFASKDEYVPAALPTVKGRVLYDRTAGHTEIVNVQSDDTTLTSICGAVAGWGINGTSGRNVSSAISTDGSHIYFTSPDPNGTGNAACNVKRQLYLRLNGSTTQVSASQRSIADPLGATDAIFQGASTTGDVVYFMSATALTNDAADGAVGELLLYRYDVSSGQLSLVTPNSSIKPRVLGVVATSGDGSRLYLLARGELVPGQGVDGAANLYSYEGGDFTFIGTVSPADGASLLSMDAFRQARVTETGDRFAFTSNANLRSFDAQGFEQVYVYDSQTDSLACASCPPGSAPVTGDAYLQRDQRSTNPRWRPRNISSNGELVFFDTPVSLVPADDNGAVDVYAWRDGAVFLLSGGHGDGASYFVDASADGEDVFIQTSDRLVPQDSDSDADLYDVRIGGGFAAPPDRETCSGSDCQDSPAGQPLAQVAASTSVPGAGNVRANVNRRCGKGKRRVKAGPRRVRCVPKTKGSRKSQKRTASNDRRAIR